MLRLIEKCNGGEAAETMTLPFELRQKSRLRVTLDSGREAGVFLPPGTQLKDGDRLRTDDGRVVAVRAAPETVSVVETGDPLLLARICYHLGNRHVPLQIGDGWARWLHDHVLDDMVRSLGASVHVVQAAFQPEAGAYHEAGVRHASHGHSHSH